MHVPADSLAGLRGLHLPAAPAAAGSGIAVAFAVGVIAAIALRSVVSAWQRGRRDRRSALAGLQATRTLPGPDRLAAQAGLLRRLVPSRPGEPPGGLRGEAWLARLDAALRTEFFSRGAGRAFGDALYRPGEVDAARLDAGLVPLLGRRGR